MTKTLWTAVAAGLLYCAVANAKDIGKQAQVEAPEPKIGTYQISCWGYAGSYLVHDWCVRLDTRTGQVVKLDPDKIPQE